MMFIHSSPPCVICMTASVDPPPAPRAPPFSPSPSLQKVADFIVTDCVRRYPKEECPLCNERALPMDPSVCSYDLKVSSVVVCGRVCCIRDESSC